MAGRGLGFYKILLLYWFIIMDIGEYRQTGDSQGKYVKCKNYEEDKF